MPFRMKYGRKTIYGEGAPGDVRCADFIEIETPM